MPKSSSFYIVGGTLPKNAACYVTRAADAQLLAYLQEGEFCYVLNTRQIGKSSLMVRTAQRLREEGILVALLDLTAIGQHVSVEEWFDGLLTLLGEQLHLQDELEDFWQEQRHLGPLQRWMQALTQIVLKQCDQPLCLFLDEIDSVRSLPFSTDEFFAGIRECYNRRVQDPLFERLTFCLLGVAAPVDLISNPLISPFNIGKRIVLTDFTSEEAAPLTRGFDAPGAETQQSGSAILNRVLYWTGGHPYLTQRLCEELAQSATLPTVREVDAACRQLFLSKQAQRTDDNLIFVRHRLLHSAASRAAILDLYRLLLIGRRIEEDTTDPRHTALHLAGIVRMQEGCLVVRNRIYAGVFDLKWALANIPAEEAQRQKAAYRRGVLRATGLFGGIAVLIAALLGMAIVNVRHTQAAEKRAAHSLYLSDINLMQREWEGDNVAHVFELMEETRSSPERGPEWDYWDRQCHQSLYTTSVERKMPDGFSAERVNALARVPGQNQVVILGDTGTLRWRDSETGRLNRTIFVNKPFCQGLAYAPDGTRLIVGVGDTVQIRDGAQGALLGTLPAINDVIKELVFAPDGTQAAGISHLGFVYLWDLGTPVRQRYGAPFHTRKDLYFHVAFTQGQVALFRSDGGIEMRDRKTGQERRRIRTGFSGEAAAFSQDGRRVVGKDRNGNIDVVDTRTGRSLLHLAAEGLLTSLCFSPDDRLIIAGQGNTLWVWDAVTGQLLHLYREHLEADVQALCLGRYLVSGARDGLVKGWDLQAPANPQTLPAGKAPLWCVAYSPDGALLATSCADGRVTIWEAATGNKQRTIQASNVRITPVAFSHDGTRLFTGDNNGVACLWNVADGRLLRRFVGAHSTINCALFSPDDQTLYAGSDDHNAYQWETATGAIRNCFQGHSMPVETLTLTHDGQRLLTGSDDGNTNVWNVRTGKLQRAPFISSAEVWGVALSPDDRTLAIGNLRRTIDLWDTVSGKRLRTLRGHKDFVIGLAFSPDGKRLASTSRDGTTRLWEMETGRETLTLTGHRGQVASVAFAPNGHHIASVGKDGDLVIWDMSPRPTKAAGTAARNYPK